MKITIDVKSVILGGVAGIAVMLAIGAGTPSDEIGRYQVSAGSQGCAVIVDTKTGQAWGFQPLSTTLWRKDGNFWDAK